jgi:glycosyltransferase involved in cell wall biosynthesis
VRGRRACRKLMTPPLRFGVNALYLIPGGVGGTEIYMRSLLAGLARIDSRNDYFVFVNRETDAGLAPKLPNFHLVRQRVRATIRPARLLWEQTVLPVAAVRLRLDALLNGGFTCPLFCPCPSVSVFHDLQHKRHPEYFRWFDLPFWQFFLFWSAHRSALLLADSEATARDLRHFYRLPERCIRVAPLAAESSFFDLSSRRHPEPFLLAVSTLHPHKNLEGLLRAFAAFRRVHPDFRLVVCGLHGFLSGPLHRLRDELALQGAVEFPGWIPREQLYDLYTRAWAFFYPSRFEGFGLPVVEALAAGVPTGCSNIDPLSWIAGDAALTFDPNDGAAMLSAMLRLVEDEDLRTRLSAAGPARAAAFSWERTAAITLEALTTVARR